MSEITRRSALGLVGIALAPYLLSTQAVAGEVLAAPVGGHAEGDLSVTVFFDYNCPYCRKARPELARFVENDPGIRLVYKDWPVLGDASLSGARLALAASYQGGYETAYRALMGLAGRRNDAARMREALRAAGLDVARLDADAAAHADAITALLAGNAADAAALGLNAVPTILVGALRVVGGFDLENFQEFAARARAKRR